MSIIIRKNKHTARIMRQEYVRKDFEGNPHGFVRQVPLATISLSAIEVPSKISAILSTKELDHLHRVVVQPARVEAERRRTEAALRERDPNWRAREALRWLGEIEGKCQDTPLNNDLRKQLNEAVKRLGLATESSCAHDPLDAINEAVQRAIGMVEQGWYGKNSGAVKKDSVAARKWAQLRSSLLNEELSLLAALQQAGWVLRRATKT